MHIARSTDPITSHEAGARAHHFAGTHKAIILECLRAYGPSGAGRISELTGLHVTQIDRRMCELRRSMQVEYLMHEGEPVQQAGYLVYRLTGDGGACGC